MHVGWTRTIKFCFLSGVNAIGTIWDDFDQFPARQLASLSNNNVVINILRINNQSVFCDKKRKF
jgi:hypothetical protein